MSIQFLSHPFSKGFSYFPMDPPLLSHDFPMNFPWGLDFMPYTTIPSPRMGSTTDTVKRRLQQALAPLAPDAEADRTSKKIVWWFVQEKNMGFHMISHDFTWFHMISSIFSDLCLVENMGLTGLIWRFEEEIMKWGTLIRAYFNHQKRSWS